MSTTRYFIIFIVIFWMSEISCSHKAIGVTKVKEMPTQLTSNGIIVFLNSKCEFSKKVVPILHYISELNDANYKLILIINPANNSLDDMHQFIHDNELTKWIAYSDIQNTLAKKNEVKKSPFVFIVNESYNVMYQGSLTNEKSVESVEDSPLIKAIRSIREKAKINSYSSIHEGCTIE